MSNQKPQDEATALREYGMAIAEVVRDECGAMADGGEAVGPRIQSIDLAAIVASVELPKQDPFDWKAERAHLKAALARPCISCGYQSKTLTPSAPSPADARREGKT